jgi:DNA mismatch repair ATPase MutS
MPCPNSIVLEPGRGILILVFEYRLAPGAATTRNAITLLELHGAPDALVRRALTRAAALDRQRRRAKALS